MIEHINSIESNARPGRQPCCSSRQADLVIAKSPGAVPAHADLRRAAELGAGP